MHGQQNIKKKKLVIQFPNYVYLGHLIVTKFQYVLMELGTM